MSEKEKKVMKLKVLDIKAMNEPYENCTDGCCKDFHRQGGLIDGEIKGYIRGLNTLEFNPPDMPVPEDEDALMVWTYDHEDLECERLPSGWWCRRKGRYINLKHERGWLPLKEIKRKVKGAQGDE